MLDAVVELAGQRAAVPGARQGVADGAVIAPAGHLERRLACGEHVDAVLLEVAQQVVRPPGR